jgi:hypothetical protein
MTLNLRNFLVDLFLKCSHLVLFSDLQMVDHFHDILRLRVYQTEHLLVLFLPLFNLILDFFSASFLRLFKFDNFLIEPKFFFPKFLFGFCIELLNNCSQLSQVLATLSVQMGEPFFKVSKSDLIFLHSNGFIMLRLEINIVKFFC